MIDGAINHCICINLRSSIIVLIDMVFTNMVLILDNNDGKALIKNWAMSAEGYFTFNRDRFP